MSTFRIKAQSLSDRWTYTGQFASGSDAIDHAIQHGARAATAIRIPPNTTTKETNP